MAHLLLFHHVLGLTDGVRAFAERIEEAGHAVTLPDLFGGRTFGSIEEGAAYADEIEQERLFEAATASLSGLPNDLVYGGISLGVLPAMRFAQQRRGARGALFFHGCVPLGYYGDEWPSGVPLQIHLMRGDPYEDENDSRALAAAANGELFLYDVNGHLFTDPAAEGFDEAATETVLSRALEFLTGL